MMLSFIPHVVCFVSMSSIVSVRRANVICRGSMSGVITANRSSGPIRRSSMFTSGLRARTAPAKSVCHVSRKITNTRRRGSAACRRPSSALTGSRRSSRAVVVDRATRSNCVTVWGLLSSSSSKSSAVRSVMGSPLALVGYTSTRTKLASTRNEGCVGAGGGAGAVAGLGQPGPTIGLGAQRRWRGREQHQGNRRDAEQGTGTHGWAPRPHRGWRTWMDVSGLYRIRTWFPGVTPVIECRRRRRSARMPGQA